MAFSVRTTRDFRPRLHFLAACGGALLSLIALFSMVLREGALPTGLWTGLGGLVATSVAAWIALRLSSGRERWRDGFQVALGVAAVSLFVVGMLSLWGDTLTEYFAFLHEGQYGYSTQGTLLFVGTLFHGVVLGLAAVLSLPELFRRRDE